MNGGPLQNGPVREVPQTGEPGARPARPPLTQHGLDAMNGETLQRKVVITNPQGLHMRPLSAFAQLAGQFQSRVTVYKNGQSVNGKSPLELMLLAAEQGTELTLEVAGPDARAALDALAVLLAAPSVDEIPQPPLPPKG
jgi:phosphocarrier protein HPr